MSALSPRHAAGSSFFDGAGPEPKGVNERKLSYPAVLPTESAVYGSPMNEEEIRAAFKKYDENGDGVLQKDEFLKWYREGIEHFGVDPEDEIDKMIDKYRLDEGETISYEQFALMMIHLTVR